MRIQRLLLVASALTALAPARLHAQQPSAPAPAEIAPARALKELKDALRWLVWAEEFYWSKHESYTTDLVTVRDAMAKQPPKEIVLSIHYAGGRAWAASAEHRGLPKRSCVIFVGSIEDFPAPATLRDGLRPQAREQGMPLCDEP